MPCKPPKPLAGCQAGASADRMVLPPTGPGAAEAAKADSSLAAGSGTDLPKGDGKDSQPSCPTVRTWQKLTQ